MSAALEITDEALSVAVPDNFGEARKLYQLRQTDREGWESRNLTENVVWLLNIMRQRLADEQSFNAHIIHLAKDKAEYLRECR